MNRPEFDTWLDRYCTLFPETSAWISRIPDNTRGPMLDAWAELMAEVEYRDAAAATDRMFSGDDPQYPPLGILFGDREKTPSHVRRLALMSRNSRLARESEDNEKRRTAGDRRLYGTSRYKHSMGELFRFLMGRLAEGIERQQAVREMREMADKLPETGERGYRPTDGYGELFK
uniref:Uncharacterized protein n=1 Tax=viral metagenome TaxID=1070528 RepID=A0A6M3L6L2_9ZZZZ